MMHAVSRETQFQRYVDLLQRWSGALNLSSRNQSDHLGWQANIQDSLALVPHLPQPLDRLVDLGSGQGFPAIPIAIATGVAVDLIEADRRKAAFLTTAMAVLGLKGTVWPSRIETVPAAPAACVTARALAPLAMLLTLAKPLLQREGCCLFLKGTRADAELAAAALTHRFVGEVFPTALPHSQVVRITGLS